MKAYGIPRTIGAEFPDKADLKTYGLSASDRCARADRGKNRARRYWKGVARRFGKAEIQEAIHDSGFFA